MIEKSYKEYGSVFTVPMMGKTFTFLVGPEVSESFFKLGDDSMSQKEVYGWVNERFKDIYD